VIAKKPIPPATRNRLQLEGTLRGRHTTRPKPDTCPHCHTPVITALHPLLSGHLLTVNNKPLTPIGEALSLLAGHTTYRIAREWLHPRTAQDIRYAPADQIDVRADHKCGHAYDTRPPRNEYPYPPWQPGMPIPECPF
jgi:hypothetical protein